MSARMLVVAAVLFSAGVAWGWDETTVPRDTSLIYLAPRYDAGRILYGGYDGTQSRIYAYDTQQGTTTSLFSLGAGDLTGWGMVGAGIQGDYAVFAIQDWGFYTTSYQFSTQTVTAPPANYGNTHSPPSAYFLRSPEVSQGVVVGLSHSWSARTQPNYIYGMDLATQKQFVIGQLPVDPWDDGQGHDYSYFHTPDISGTRVVWSGPTSVSDVVVTDLATGTTINVPADLGMQERQHPRFDGDWVVWEDGFAGGTFGIGGRNLATGEEFDIAPSHWMVAGSAQLSGNLVVWADKRNGDSDIYGYDIAKGQVFPVHVGPGDQEFPDVCGDKVVWIDANGGVANAQVVIATVPEPTTLSLLALAALAGQRRRG